MYFIFISLLILTNIRMKLIANRTKKSFLNNLPDLVSSFLQQRLKEKESCCPSPSCLGWWSAWGRGRRPWSRRLGHGSFGSGFGGPRSFLNCQVIVGSKFWLSDFRLLFIPIQEMVHWFSIWNLFFNVFLNISRMIRLLIMTTLHVKSIFENWKVEILISFKGR